MRVLVIDDDEMFLDSFAKSLEYHQFEVKPVQDSRLALHLYREMEPNLICIDYVMPVFDGLQVGKQFRLLDKDIPLIMITGFSNTKLEKKASVAGFNHLIEKDSPLSLANMISQISDTNPNP